ncbi:MAG: hypothetical protein ACTSP4_00195 [Candidatus Hodarchaeales archaeon]
MTILKLKCGDRRRIKTCHYHTNGKGLEKHLDVSVEFTELNIVKIAAKNWILNYITLIATIAGNKEKKLVYQQHQRREQPNNQNSSVLGAKRQNFYSGHPQATYKLKHSRIH